MDLSTVQTWRESSSKGKNGGSDSCASGHLKWK